MRSRASTTRPVPQLYMTLAMAAATFGLVSGGLIGGPIATALIGRHRLKTPGRGATPEAVPKGVEVIR